jgi:hypothetical protein
MDTHLKGFNFVPTRSMILEKTCNVDGNSVHALIYLVIYCTRYCKLTRNAPTPTQKMILGYTFSVVA